MIEKGQIGPMVRNATMMGNGPKVLLDIDMAGTDLGFGIGTCGKDGQGVPVSRRPAHHQDTRDSSRRKGPITFPPAVRPPGRI